MSALIDTNILLRRAQHGHSSHALAAASVAKLLATGEPLYVTLQNISEFWNVATRPQTDNGLGFSVAVTLELLEKIERIFTLLPDSPAVYKEWRRLVVRHGVLESKVHDAKLVAIMNVHGVRRILTFNIGDFERFQVEAIHPA